MNEPTVIGQDDVTRRDVDAPTLLVGRTIQRAGGGIRWVYHRTIVYAFLISVALHLGVILLYAFTQADSGLPVKPFRSLPPLGELRDTHYIAIDTRRLVVSNPGGGGGAPDVPLPVGPAKAGDPGAAPKFDPKNPRVPNPRTFAPKAPPRAKPVDKPADQRPVATTDRDTARETSTGDGLRGQHAEGRGTTDAGGSGGRGVGRGTGVGVGDGDGLGGRGWLRPPSRKPIENLAVAGSVRLSFTVMPNGEITNIAPIRKAHPTLVQEAIRRLSNAKVKPLPESAAQVPVRSALTFNFEIR